MKEEKQQIRKKILEIRRSLTPEEIDKKSLSIIEKITNLPEYQKAEKILYYFPINNEVDLRPLIEKTIAEKQILLPKIKENLLTIHKISNLSDLKDGVYNTKEPHELAEIVEDKEIDLILVPGIAFDKYGNRLGYGKGYFDRLLKNAICPKVGISFELQIMEEIPAESHDQKMDLIITEKQIIHI